MKEIGEKIKTQRQNLGISQGGFAKLLNVSAAAYCKIENGQTDLNISRLMQICKVLKVRPIVLFTDDHNSPTDSQQVIILKKELVLQEEELNRLRKKVIDLYEKLGI